MTITKIRPLCLREHEVRALLRDGRVTVARVMKPQPEYIGPASLSSLHRDDPTNWGIPGRGGEWHTLAVGGDSSCDETCVVRGPFGEVGDKLIVKEEWAKPEQGVMSRNHDGSPIYAADYPPFVLPGFGPWRSPNCMPRAYSRLTVVPDAVRCEQNDGVWQWLGDLRRTDI